MTFPINRLSCPTTSRPAPCSKITPCLGRRTALGRPLDLTRLLDDDITDKQRTNLHEQVVLTEIAHGPAIGDQPIPDARSGKSTFAREFWLQGRDQ